MDAPDAISILQRDARSVDVCLRQVLALYQDAPPKLIEAVEYSLFAGGKRLRPALVLESWRACGGAEESRTAALTGAAAIELVHTFSLVHDDLPAMDDDDLRRGKPTSHKVFGEAMAILAGDAMLAMAFEIIARHVPATAATAMTLELSAATGPLGMIGGQVLDIESENQTLGLEELERVHRRKTGALLAAACRIGAIAAGADESRLRAVTDFGRHLGLAFQIVDDLLDVTATTSQLGKTARKDARKGKNTYPALMGVDASRAQAERVLARAIDALIPVQDREAGLIELARFVVQRSK